MPWLGFKGNSRTATPLPAYRLIESAFCPDHPACSSSLSMFTRACCSGVMTNTILPRLYRRAPRAARARRGGSSPRTSAAPRLRARGIAVSGRRGLSTPHPCVRHDSAQLQDRPPAGPRWAGTGAGAAGAPGAAGRPAAPAGVCPLPPATNITDPLPCSVLRAAWMS